MLAKAQRLVKKYTQPNPPGMGPSVRSDEGILEIWAWAEANDRTDILSGLAQTVCVLLRSSDDKPLLQSKLHKFAEQAKEEQQWKEYADFLMALAKLESYAIIKSAEEEATIEASRLALYEEALDIYTRLDDWASEATCASLAASIYHRWHKFDEVRRLSLRSYMLWAKAKHKKGIAKSFFTLSSLLEIEGKYVAACRLMYCAKKLAAHSIGAISARDSLSNMRHEYKISPGQYESRKPALTLAEELVSEIFGISL